MLRTLRDSYRRHQVTEIFEVRAFLAFAEIFHRKVHNGRIITRQLHTRTGVILKRSFSRRTLISV